MNCARARAALALGEPSEGGSVDRHLRGCASCAGLLQVDRKIDEARRRLVAEPPASVDVRARVLAEIARLAPGGREELRAWHLALACCASGFGVVALAVMVWTGSPDWQSAARGIDGSLRAMGHVLSALGAIATAALRAALPLVSLLREAGRWLADWSGLLEPFAVAGVGLSYAAMTLTIVRVLERDLRRNPRFSSEEWRP